MTDDDLDWDQSVVLEPHGDRLCQCACGCARELLAEEDAMCTDCYQGRHPGER